MDNTSTTKFHNSLPFALFPVSPSLTALHNIRTRSHSHPFPQCLKCASYLHVGTSHLRLVRSHSRVLQTTCLACDHVQTTQLEIGNAPSSYPASPSRGDAVQPSAITTPANTQHQSPTPLPLPADLPATSIAIHKETSYPASSSSQSRSRPKKKTGLQEMLARNREKQKERIQKEKGKQQGLSAFLSGL